ncbi:hypothetical protein NOR_01161 [Metarhizium rileyi]|uniref:Uncharacterized protein n=1 Tax=Metarhizium rileyi (strain RCEF 4871) TaxID=1649241 RepID=A0A162JU83_METRR|nr:hypothetical protein NOR_01161 [Metarhizium rileyi RCEF 4871]
MTAYRAGCTDKEFKSKSCASYCHDSSSGAGEYADRQHSGVWACGNSRFACDPGLCNTRNFTVPGGKIIDNPALRDDVVALTTTTTATATCSGTRDSWRRCRGTVTIGTAVSIGVGIGVPLACATAAFATLFLRERKKGKLRQSQKQQYEDTILDAGSTTQLTPLTPSRSTGVEASRSEVTGDSVRSEVMGTQRHELSG